MDKPTKDRVNSVWRHKMRYEGSAKKIEQAFNRINENRDEANKLSTESLDIMQKFILHELAEKEKREAKKENKLKEANQSGEY